MTDFSALGGNLSEFNRAAVVQAISYLAALKNIELTPSFQAHLADGVLATQKNDAALMIDGVSAPFAPVHLPMRETPCPFPSAMRVVNDYLDAVAFNRLSALVARVEGK